MNKINIRVATASDNSSIVATLLDPNGQPVKVDREVDGKIKSVELAGSFPVRGRRTSEDDGLTPREIALAHLMRKLPKFPELCAAYGWDMSPGQRWEPSFIEVSGVPVKKAPKLVFRGFATGFATPAEGPVEGHISAANQATGKDCGLVTVASDPQTYNQVAGQAVETVAVLAADFAEQNLETTGLTTMTNSVMESGAVGEKALGYFRKDGEGRTEGSKSDVPNPMMLPTTHKPASTAQSINQRKGVVGLRTTEADCRSPNLGAFIQQKTAAKGRTFKPAKSEVFKDVDPRVGLYMNTFVRNPALTLGKELAERMTAEQKAYNELRAEKKEELAAQGLSVSWDKRKGQAVQSLCRGIANIVARCELGLGFGSKEEGASEADRVVRTWIESTIAKGAAVGLTITIQNGQCLINDKPVTWHKAVIAAELELRAAVNG